MKTEHIDYILEICETKSIRQASKNLFLTQPNLSNAIKNIELELGFSIFNRSKDGVTLTPEGVEFVEYAKNIRSNMENIKYISNKKDDTEFISFKLSSQLFSYTLDTFFEFHNQFNGTNTNFKIEFSNCVDAIDNVISKVSDFALIYIHNDNERSWYNNFYSHNIDFFPIADAHLCVCVGPNSRLVDKEYVSLGDLFDIPLVLFDNYDDSPLYKTLIKDIKFDGFKNKITIHDYYSYFDTIKNRDVISFVPIFDTYTSKSYIKNNLTLKSIRFDNMPSFTFGYIKLSSISLNKIHYDFLSLLRSNIGI